MRCLRYFLFCFLAGLLLPGLTSQVTISGTVLLFGNGGPGVPIATYPLGLVGPDGQAFGDTETDLAGNYTFVIDDASPGESWIVELLDPCILIVANATVVIEAGVTDYAGIDFEVCGGFGPPSNTDTCFAAFVAENFPGQELNNLVIFSNLSVANTNDPTYTWDFGDGTIVVDNNTQVLHNYPAGGSYVVTLTLDGDSCTAVLSEEVEVFDPQNCDCAGQPIEPVCINNDLGLVANFDNPCLAECAGFTPNEFFSCDPDCVCPTFNSPICAIEPNGDTLTFTNYCFAECEGYGPDTWLECHIPPPPDCDCSGLPDEPVCVDLGLGFILPFRNACRAECAGFDSSMFADCTGDNCGCPDFVDLVCVPDPITGDTLTFENFCLAGCAGYDNYGDFFQCGIGGDTDPGCLDCGLIGFDPVCVIDPAGDTLTFDNFCYATCSGYDDPGAYVECATCVCDGLPDVEVCAFDPITGSDIFFDNPCQAICAGFSPLDLNACPFVLDTCVANFEWVPDSQIPLTIIFLNASQVFGEIASINWDFGDGNSSNEFNPVHTYAVAGDYSVSMTFTDTSGCTSAVSYLVPVEDPVDIDNFGCQAFFFFEQPDPNEFLTFQFVDYSLGDVVSYEWDFGDGSFSNQANPIHTFTVAGEYQVSLTTIDAEGCSSNLAIVITAGENVWYGDFLCRAWFLPYILPDQLQVYLFDLSSLDVVTYAWDFGDGNVSSEANPLHTYAEVGVYTIRLTITTETGCENTYESTVDLGGSGFTSNPQFSLVSSTSEVPNPDPKTPNVTLLAVPNPSAGDRTQIRWESSVTEPYLYRVLDPNGRQLLSGSGRSIVGENQFDLPIADLPAGLYFIRLESASASGITKLIRR